MINPRDYRQSSTTNISFSFLLVCFLLQFSGPIFSLTCRTLEAAVQMGGAGHASVVSTPPSETAMRRHGRELTSCRCSRASSFSRSTIYSLTFRCLAFPRCRCVSFVSFTTWASCQIPRPPNLDFFLILSYVSFGIKEQLLWKPITLAGVINTP